MTPQPLPIAAPDLRAKAARVEWRAYALALVTLAVLAGVLLAGRDAAAPGPSRDSAAASPLPPSYDAQRLGLLPTDWIDRDAGAPGLPRAIVVHLRHPACACTAMADQRFLALTQRHFGTGVLFAFADPPGAAGAPERGLERLTRLPDVAAKPLWAQVGAGPVVAVFDGQGRARYLGGYAAGRECSTERGGAVEAVLAALEPGRTGDAAQLPAGAGCRCALTEHGARQGPGGS